ncbi:SCO family protein [Thalassospiraceae bacterium LMO-SO8]|nr:SCO family protein [Alphaproteobacteria bacterium LMO-S08]WND77899.1 SCO family protein [Thalassospiraceae bacterium LMO-SO8]
MTDHPNKTVSRLRLVRRVAIGLAAIILVAVVAVIAEQRLTDTPRTGTAPEVKIGGPFTLTDHTGRQVTEKDFQGKAMLIFFGYTYCPDVCPTSLTEISAAMDKLGPLADKVVPILVSIDPERDTPEVLKDYVAHFHPGIVGLTGTLEQIKQAARVYRVYFAKVPDKGGDKDAYLMDHSSVIYLMGPNGKFLAHFSTQTDAETMAAKIKSLL